MAAHHSYIEVICEICKESRIARKDVFTKLKKEGKPSLCRSCALRTRPVTWKKDEAELLKNQGAYSSYCRAKRRVAINHKNAYGHVEFRFESYKQFLAEIGPRPERMSLDRIDPNGHYEPGNVRWATFAEQCRNRRNNVTVEFNGKKMCLQDAAEASGIHRSTLAKRLKNGCPPELLFMKGRWRYRNGRLANQPVFQKSKTKAA